MTLRDIATRVEARLISPEVDTALWPDLSSPDPQPGVLATEPFFPNPFGATRIIPAELRALSRSTTDPQSDPSIRAGVVRILGAWLDSAEPSYKPAKLAKIAEASSDTERRAADAERELVEWKKVNFMADRVGDEFPALIISTQKFGFFVELEELFVEGLVHIETLRGDRFRYQESTRKIIGSRTRRRFSIGDQVRVRLDRVDAIERNLSFSLVQTPRRR